MLKRTFKQGSILPALIALLWNSLAASVAFSQSESFYKGKQIRVVTGATAGGFYDRWARLLARTMPKYIPGQPDIIVQNMPGGGSLVAMNYVYGVVKPDGLTTVMPNSNIYLDQLSGHKEVRFDLRKFPIIGSQEKNYMLLYMRADAPYKTISDIIKAKEPPKCGTTGTGNMGYLVPKLLEETVAAKFNVISGYQGGNEIDLAVERGEIQCRSLSTEAYFSREPFHTWRKNGFSRELVQGGRTRIEALANVPTIFELMDRYKTPETGRRLASTLLASGDFHRPYLAPPKIRPDLVKSLREAFTKTMKDPDFLAETKKKKLDLDPTTGEEVEALTKEVMSQPKEVVERLKKMMGK